MLKRQNRNMTTEFWMKLATQSRLPQWLYKNYGLHERKLSRSVIPGFAPRLVLSGMR